jgi:hypothetical protein
LISRPAMPWWQILFLGIGVAVIAIVALHIHAAQAHMHDRPDLNTWFGGLENQRKHGCCAYTEGVALATDEVRTTEIDQCRDDYAMDRQPNLPAHYCVRVQGEWWKVPDNALVLEPNRYGQAVVWPVRSQAGPVDIRCFMPGALT